MLKITVGKLLLRMAGSQEKATNWFHETRKQYKLPKSKTESQGKDGCGEKRTEVSSSSNSYNCSYCPKVFVDARFLVKHVLRRHSEKIVHLHKRLLALTNSENCLPSSSDLINYLRMEFSDLKGELEIVKQTVSQYMCQQSENQSSVKAAVVQKPFKRKDSLQGNRTLISEYISNESSIPIVQASTAENQELSAKVDELFQIYKEDLISKEKTENKLALREEKICAELKTNLSSEFKNMLLCQEQKNTSKWEKNISELHKEIKRLDAAVMWNSQRINSPETLQVLEKRFEHQLQNMVKGSLLFSNKRKHANPKSIEHSCRRKKSLYTCSSQPLNRERSEPSDQKTCLSLAERRGKKIQGQTQTKDRSFRIESMESAKFDANEIKVMVDERLKNLNIDPKVEALPPDEYEMKMGDLKLKKETLSSKFVNFSETLDKVDTYVNKIVKSREKGKCSKKLRFSDSPDVPAPGSEGKDLTCKQSNFADAKISTSPVEVVQDCYAQGDCLIGMAKVTDIPNALIIEGKENVLKSSDDEYNCELERFKHPKNILNNSDTTLSEVVPCRSPDSLNSAHVKTVLKKEDFQISKCDLNENVGDLSELSSLSDLEN